MRESEREKEREFMGQCIRMGVIKKRVGGAGKTIEKESERARKEQRDKRRERE